MNEKRVYLDYNATAPLRPAAREAVLRALDLPGNASSVHAEGRAARAVVEEARRSVARLAGGYPRGVVFTASATEALNLVLTPGLRVPCREEPRRLLVGATEHACVLAGHRFDAVQVIPVGRDGVVDLGALRAMLQDGPALVALQAANNETGVLQPVREAADLAHAAGSSLVCDAVQAPGRIVLSMPELGADALVLSSHKIGGPKGAGAVLFADPETHIQDPLLRGGGQERGLRAGTEDVPAIAGFAAAAHEVCRLGGQEAAASAGMRDGFERELRLVAPETVIFGQDAPRLPNPTCFAVPGLKAATLLMALDLAGCAVSAGSACSSGKVARSHVLDAMGEAPHIAEGAIRVSFGWASKPADTARLLQAMAGLLARARRSGRAA